MAYTWTTGEVITAEKLNATGGGENIPEVLFEVSWDETDHLYIVDATMTPSEVIAACNPTGVDTPKSIAARFKFSNSGYVLNCYEYEASYYDEDYYIRFKFMETYNEGLTARMVLYSILSNDNNWAYEGYEYILKGQEPMG